MKSGSKQAEEPRERKHKLSSILIKFEGVERLLKY
jgi:hypothetical protein